MESVVQVINEVGPFDLIIIDTMAAYFGGDDENNNVQAGNYARELRKLTFLGSKPAVLSLCHPVKGATKGNLLPRGGGAFLNEVDGNLTVWGDGNDQTELHWGGKFRGPNFLPASFKLNVVHPRALVDDKGREMPTVLAEYIEDSEAIVLADDAIRLEDRVMIDINHHAKSSVRERAERIDVSKSTVHRALVALKAKKLVEEVRGSPFELMVTGAGHKALERRGLDRPSNGPVDGFDDV
jgi:DNA-binding transcriptional ArsR family regulator